MNILVALQSFTETGEVVEEAIEAIDEEKISILELLVNGGWYIMIPLAILSVIAIYIFFERMLAINKANKVESNFMARITDYISDGKIDSALDFCKQNDSPLSHMIHKGVSKIGKPIKEISASIENVGKLEIGRLEKGLATLATVAGAAPMIGFLGTVIGMIVTFHAMMISPNGVEIPALAGGIMQAMVTTVAGLVIGIIAYVAYNILVTRVSNVIHDLEAASLDFLDLLDAPGN
jgi:biopolymer transport protein ExbB